MNFAKNARMEFTMQSARPKQERKCLSDGPRPAGIGVTERSTGMPGQSSGRFAAFPPLADELHHDGYDRQENNREDHQLEIFLHEGLVAKEETGVGKEVDPDEAANKVIGEEPRVGHRTDAGDKGDKGAHNGYETSKDD